MSFKAIQHHLAVSPTAQCISQLEPIASAVMPFVMLTSAQLTWSNAAATCLATFLAMNEAVYFKSNNPHRDYKLVHECNQILMLALFVNSFVKAYQTGSWKPLRPLILYAPLFASIGKSHPIFRIISRIPNEKPKDEEIEKVSELLRQGSLFVIRSDDYPLQEMHQLVHNCNKKDKHGRHPYRIFRLSMREVMGCGKQWKERLLETFDYLENQGRTIVLIDQFDWVVGLKGDTISPYAFLMCAELPKNIHFIGFSEKPVVLTDTCCLNYCKKPGPSTPKELICVSDEPIATVLDSHRDKAQQVLEVLGNQYGMNRVCLVGEEEFEKKLLMSSIAHLLEDAKPPLEGHTIYSVHFADLFDEKSQPKPAIFEFAIEANVILYVHGIEEGFGLLTTGGSFSKPQFRAFLDSPKIKLIISASQEQFETLRKDHPPFERTFALHKMEPLTKEAKKTFFEKEKEQYPDAELSADLQDKILAIRGPCPVREQCSLLGQMVSIMNQRSCTEEEALDVIKVQVSHQSRSFLPPNLIELTSRSEDVICLEREREVLEVLITLHSKDGQNNVCLVGDAGCGKTQLVRFIASSIKRGECRHFEDYRVFSFSISSIMSGSTYMGMWQGKLRKILEFCQSQGKAIVFIDEIHLTIGNGKSEGNDTMDIAQMMKEYITDPDLRIIGATTPAEYLKYVGQDPAFADRFKVMELAPLSEENQLKALTAHSLKHSTTGEALPQEALRTILGGEGGSLRTSVGRVAQVHAYMSYMESEDVNAAISWTRGER